MKCWFHGQEPCPDHARCVKNGNVDPPDGQGDLRLHRPNRYSSWAEEAHARRYPGVPWDGIVPDLATPEVRAGWSSWGRSADGRQGPVVKRGDKRELETLCKVAGVRMMEPGEILAPQSRKAQLAARGRKLSDYWSR